jgi:hypothetical protein
MDQDQEMANLHSAGATVRHSTPFDSLPDYRNTEELSVDFIKKWVAPFYMELGSSLDTNWVNEVKEIKREITPETVARLLGDFNWRTRLVGTYFAAVKGYGNFIEIIGTLLLKSELCCVGHMYVLALIFLDPEKSIAYFESYLDYYLRKPELYFDQEKVMEGLYFLDQQHQTHYLDKYRNHWITLQKERRQKEERSAHKIALLIEKDQGKAATEEFLQSLHTKVSDASEHSADNFKKQIAWLQEIQQY